MRCARKTGTIQWIARLRMIFEGFGFFLVSDGEITGTDEESMERVSVAFGWPGKHE